MPGQPKEEARSAAKVEERRLAQGRSRLAAQLLGEMVLEADRLR
jgi:hypothetical protein